MCCLAAEIARRSNTPGGKGSARTPWAHQPAEKSIRISSPLSLPVCSFVVLKQLQTQYDFYAQSPSPLSPTR